MKKCESKHCESINDKHTNILNGKSFCGNCAVNQQIQANKYAVVNKVEPIILFPDNEPDLKNTKAN